LAEYGQAREAIRDWAKQFELLTRTEPGKPGEGLERDQSLLKANAGRYGDCTPCTPPSHRSKNGSRPEGWHPITPKATC